MSVEDLPILAAVFDAGADDRVFDGLLLAGPLLICVLAVAGRTQGTTVIAAGYLAVFVGHILYKAGKRRALTRR